MAAAGQALLYTPYRLHPRYRAEPIWIDQVV